jgi:hypothetical protein
MTANQDGRFRKDMKMRTLLKVVAVSSALLVAAQAVPAAARDHHNGDDMLAAGIAGLAAGVIAGAIVSGSQDNGPREVQTYDDTPPPPRYRERPVYYQGGDDGYRPASYNSVRPWSRDWYRICGDRYDSFDPQTGTYIDAYGDERFCKVR